MTKERRRLHVLLDEDLDSKLRIILADPSTGKLRYGQLSSLVNRLLLDWAIKELEKKATPR